MVNVPAKASPKTPKTIRVGKTRITVDEMRAPENFPRLWLGESLYKWQSEVLAALGPWGARVALKAANGSGKTSKVTVAAIMWAMMRYPGSRVVCTAGVYRQVADVLWPVINTKAMGMGGEANGWKVTENKVEFLSPAWPSPSLCHGFTASDPNKAEGHHARGPEGVEHLLYVIDEAKGVPDVIFEAMERCQPTRVLVVSSPGGTAGTFYNIFHKADPRYKLFTVTAYDCPHITKEWIDQQIATYGEKSALVRSMIFAEFGEEDGLALILPPSVLQRVISTPPAKEGTTLYAGCDFAAGGDENVIVVREGNSVKQVIAWREKDTMAAVGRYVTEFKRLGLEADRIYGDAGGLGLPMCDALREAGWAIQRVNNGEAARSDEKFANRGTEMWVQFARMVETGKVALSADEAMHRQLTTRRLDYNSKGKLMAEPKEKMRARGLGSPDRADAVVLAFCGAGQSMEEYQRQFGRRVTFSDIAEYADQDDGDTEGKGTLTGCHAG